LIVSLRTSSFGLHPQLKREALSFYAEARLVGNPGLPDFQFLAARRIRSATRYQELTMSVAKIWKASVALLLVATIHSWYLVSKEDHALNPDLERFYAKRMGATTSEIDASHVAFISHPKVVARLIEQAAMATEKSGQ
jgi:hypothetical protein